MAASLTGSRWGLKMKEPRGACGEEETREMQMLEQRLGVFKNYIKKAKKRHQEQLKKKKQRRVS